MTSHPGASFACETLTRRVAALSPRLNNCLRINTCFGLKKLESQLRPCAGDGHGVWLLNLNNPIAPNLTFRPPLCDPTRLHRLSKWSPLPEPPKLRISRREALKRSRSGLLFPRLVHLMLLCHFLQLDLIHVHVGRFEIRSPCRTFDNKNPPEERTKEA